MANDEGPGYTQGVRSFGAIKPLNGRLQKAGKGAQALPLLKTRAWTTVRPRRSQRLRTVVNTRSSALTHGAPDLGTIGCASKRLGKNWRDERRAKMFA